MTPSSSFGRWLVPSSYVAGAGGVAAAALLLPQTDLVFDWVPTTVALLYLGPLGVAALFVLFIPLAFGLILPMSTLLGVAVAVAMGVAILNVVIVRRWMVRAGAGTGIVDGARRRRAWDQLLGGAFFVLAGCAFICLSVLAGFTALTAHGVDVAVPDVRASHVLLLAGLTWWWGLGIAVASLVVWILRARKARPLLPWAAGDLGLISGLIAILGLRLG
jgi:hypothetical protein